VKENGKTKMRINQEDVVLGSGNDSDADGNSVEIEFIGHERGHKLQCLR
jgi:hypothetical protein